jgi:hypothetical protein
MGVRCLSISKKCSELEKSLKNIDFFLEKQQYTISPRGYTINDPAPGIECMIAVDKYNYDRDAASQPIVLGDTFLRNFRATYDFNAVSVTLSVNPVNHAGIQVIGLSSGGITYIIAGSGVLLCLIAIMMCCIFCGKCRRASPINRNWESTNCSADEENSLRQDDILLDAQEGGQQSDVLISTIDKESQ